MHHKVDKGLKKEIKNIQVKIERGILDSQRRPLKPNLQAQVKEPFVPIQTPLLLQSLAEQIMEWPESPMLTKTYILNFLQWKGNHKIYHY